MVAGFVAVPVGADPSLNVVRPRNVVGQLSDEERVEPLPVELAAHTLDVVRNVVGHIP